MLENNKIVISTSNKPAKSVNNVAIEQAENFNMIKLIILLLMALVLNHYVFCKILGKEEYFWDLLEQFNEFCERNTEIFIKGSVSFFMFAVGVSLVTKSVAYSLDKKNKKSNLSTPAKIIQSLKKEVQPVKIEEKKLLEICKDEEVNEILSALSFLTILRDYKTRTVEIRFDKNQKEFVVMPSLFGNKSDYSISVNIVEFFENILRDMKEAGFGIDYKYINSSMTVVFVNNAQLIRFVNFVLRVVQVIIDSEINFLECKKALQWFKESDCDKRIAKLTEDLKWHLKQKVANLKDYKNNKLVSEYIKNINKVNASIEKTCEKQNQIKQILLKLPFEKIIESNKNKKLLSIYDYQKSISRVEVALEELTKQYQNVKSCQRKFLKGIQGNNDITIKDLMVEQQVSMQMGMT